MQISTLLNQDAKLLDQLVDLLLKEQAALVDMDIDSMESLLDQKGELLKTISDATTVRHLTLGKVGFEANETGMSVWVSQQASERDKAAWKQFQAELMRAKELNRLNGQMINQHFKRNQSMLNQLQGKPANSGVYGPNGQTTSSNRSRGVIAV